MKQLFLWTAALLLSVPSLVLAQQSNRAEAFIGIYRAHIGSTKAKVINASNRYGSYVTAIAKNSGADKAGLRALDYVYGVNDARIDENNNLNDLLLNHSPGETVTVHYLRSGQALSTSLTLGTRSNEGKTKIGSFLGVSASGEYWRTYNTDRKVQGAYVGAIIQKTNAVRMGLQAKDILVRVNEFELKDWHDLEYAMDNIDPCEPITVQYYRDGKYAKTSTYPSRTRYEEDMPTCPEVIEETEEEEVVEVAPIQEEEEEETEVEAKPTTSNNASTLNNNSLEALEIFPNPSAGIINVSFNLAQQGITSLEIYNIEGKQVYQRALGNFEGNYNERIDLSEEAPGTYFVRVLQGDETMVKKVVIVAAN